AAVFINGGDLFLGGREPDPLGDVLAVAVGVPRPYDDAGLVLRLEHRRGGEDFEALQRRRVGPHAGGAGGDPVAQAAVLLGVGFEALAAAVLQAARRLQQQQALFRLGPVHAAAAGLARHHDAVGAHGGDDRVRRRKRGGGSAVGRGGGAIGGDGQQPLAGVRAGQLDRRRQQAQLGGREWTGGEQEQAQSGEAVHAAASGCQR